MEVKETLKKQLQLLSERSEDASTSDLVRISEAMCKIAETLQKDSESLNRNGRHSTSEILRRLNRGDLMAAKKGKREERKIKVITYVYVGSKENKVRFSDLTPEQQREAGTQLKEKYLNALFAGRAEFYRPENAPPM